MMKPRTNTQQQGFERLQAVMHYVCDMAQNPDVLGRVKLNKVPWYADTLSYMLHGKPITGVRYIKRQHGPVPACFMPAQRQLEADGKIVRGKKHFYNRMKEEFTSIKEPDISMFTSDELEILREAFTHVCLRHTATSVSLETHDDIWELAEIGEEIPLETVFASELAEIDEKDIHWARYELATAA